MRALDKAIREAADAHTRLNTFYAVIAILEDTLPGGCSKADNTATTIIRKCKLAAQVQLEKYDAARDEIHAAFLDAGGQP